MSVIEDFEKGVLKEEGNTDSEAYKLGEKYSDLKDEIGTVIAEIGLAKGALTPKTAGLVNKVLTPVKRLGMFAGLEKLMPGNLTITKSLNNAIHAAVSELDNADAEAKITVVNDILDGLKNFGNITDPKKFLSNYIKGQGKFLADLTGVSSLIHPIKTIKKTTRRIKRMTKKIVNKTAHYEHVPGNAFSIPSGYPKSTGYEGAYVPTLAVHEVICNPFFNETKSSDRVEEFMQWLKADRGLSSLNYSYDDIKRYISDHLEAVIKYCRLQFAMRASITIQFQNDDIRDMILEALGFDKDDFLNHLADYQQFIKEMVPTLNAKSLSVFKQLDDRIIEVSNYFFADNRNRYQDTAKLFVITHFIAYRFDSVTQTYGYVDVDITDAGTYDDIVADWDALFARIKKVKAFTDLSSDIRGAFGVSGLTTNLPNNWAEPLSQGVADTLLKTQIMNAVVLNYVLTDFLYVGFIPDDEDALITQNITPKFSDFTRSIYTAADGSAYLKYDAVVENDLGSFEINQGTPSNTNFVTVHAPTRTSVSNDGATYRLAKVTGSAKDVYTYEASKDVSISIITPNDTKQYTPAQSLEIVQLIPGIIDKQITVNAISKSGENAKATLTETATISTTMFAIENITVYGANYSPDGQDLIRWKYNMDEMDSQDVQIYSSNRPHYDRSSARLSSEMNPMPVEQFAMMVNEEPVLHTKRVLLLDKNQSSGLYPQNITFEATDTQLVDVQVIGDLSTVALATSKRATAQSLYWFTNPSEEALESSKRKNVLYALAAAMKDK